MSDETTEKTARTSPLKWPLQWVREEKFWQDVATRTLSAIIAAGFLYLFAVGAGYVTSPDTTRILKGLVVSIGPFVVAGVFGLVLGAVDTRTKKPWVRRVTTGIFCVLGIYVVVQFVKSVVQAFI